MTSSTHADTAGGLVKEVHPEANESRGNPTEVGDVPDTYENQPGSATASGHRPTDPNSDSSEIGSKGEYAGTTYSSNAGETSVSGGMGTGVNRQIGEKGESVGDGGQGKEDKHAMGGGSIKKAVLNKLGAGQKKDE